MPTIKHVKKNNKKFDDVSILAYIKLLKIGFENEVRRTLSQNDCE